LPCHISALPIQADQKILPSQLRRSQAYQQLPSPEPAITLLDRSHRRVQASTTPSRSTNSLIATIPATGVNAGSGAPTRTFRQADGGPAHRALSDAAGRARDGGQRRQTHQESIRGTPFAQPGCSPANASSTSDSTSPTRSTRQPDARVRR
jgi:hypothetical protein